MSILNDHTAMTKKTVAEAKQQFCELVELANRGKSTTITRHNEPVACVVPAERDSRRLTDEWRRRVTAVWRGTTRTYDLRGKRFCMVMAGNPYTEQGERFQIPDMLSNRADTYNLGEVLEGKDALFALSYIENALTSNATLAPLAGRSPADVDCLIRMARGEEVPATDLSYPYSATEISEMVKVLRHLFALL